MVDAGAGEAPISASFSSDLRTYCAARNRALNASSRYPKAVLASRRRSAKSIHCSQGDLFTGIQVPAESRFKKKCASVGGRAEVSRPAQVERGRRVNSCSNTPHSAGDPDRLQCVRRHQTEALAAEVRARKER
jgi:hypothetical protein